MSSLSRDEMIISLNEIVIPAFRLLSKLNIAEDYWKNGEINQRQNTSSNKQVILIFDQDEKAKILITYIAASSSIQ